MASLVGCCCTRAPPKDRSAACGRSLVSGLGSSSPDSRALGMASYRPRPNSPQKAVGLVRSWRRCWQGPGCDLRSIWTVTSAKVEPARSPKSAMPHVRSAPRGHRFSLLDCLLFSARASASISQVKQLPITGSAAQGCKLWSVMAAVPDDARQSGISVGHGLTA